MTLEYDDCIRRGKIRSFSRGKSLASKELETSASDFERAKKTYKDGDYKWATIQIYTIARKPQAFKPGDEWHPERSGGQSSSWYETPAFRPGSFHYSMFHSARALLYSRNLREHSHFCLIEAIRILFVETKQIPLFLLEGFQEAKNLREEADYYNRWSKHGCEKLLKIAQDFIERARTIVEK